MSIEPVELTTPRLRLRPFTLDDAPDVERLAGAREVAATTVLIPHPYPEGEAARWIATHEQNRVDGSGSQFAIVQRDGDVFSGAVGLGVDFDHHRAELGYWVAVPCWGQGLATEAAQAVVDYGFEVLGLRRVYAHHMRSNAASGRVLEKVGMQHEGRLRQHLVKWGETVDLELYGLLREDWPGPRDLRCAPVP